MSRRRAPRPRSLRPLRALAACAACALLGGAPPAAGAGDAARASAAESARPAAGTGGAPPVERLVSLNPSLTAIALALGARHALVGVDDFSARQMAEVADLPTVGGLYDPSLEAVVALQPDVVAWVPSEQQAGFERRLEALGVPVERFENLRFEQVLANIERLGRLLGREAAAHERVAAIRGTREQLEALASGRPEPRILVVLQRSPLYVVGRGSFVDSMLEAVGARNLGRAFDEPYPRASLEWAVEAAPEVIVDVAPGAEREAAGFWSRWPSLPAVAHGRVVTLPGESVVLPGPWLDRSLRRLGRAVGLELDLEPEGGADRAPTAADAPPRDGS